MFFRGVCYVVFFFVYGMHITESYMLHSLSINSIFSSLGIRTVQDTRETKVLRNDTIPTSMEKKTVRSVYLCEDIVKKIHLKYKTDLLYGEEINKEKECQPYNENPVTRNECQRLYMLHSLIYILMKYNMEEKDVCSLIGLDGVQDDMIPAEDRLSCQVCQFTGAYVEKMVVNDPTVPSELVSSTVDMICESVLGPKNEKCSVIIAQVPDLMDKMSKHQHSETILTSCMNSHVCPSSFSNKITTNTTIDVNINNGTQLCEFCKSVVSMVEKAVQKDEETYEMISDAISVMCSYMPADSRCHILVDKLEMIVQWIRQGTVPDHICMELNFCSIDPPPFLSPFALSNGSQYNSSLGKDVTLKSANKLSCILCEYVADAVQVAVLYDRQALPSIKEGIENLCSYLPPFFECSVMVKNFDKVVDMFDKGKQPIEACNAIQMCEPEQSLMIATFLKNKGLSGLHQFSTLKSKDDKYSNTNLLTDLIFGDDGNNNQ